MTRKLALTSAVVLLMLGLPLAAQAANKQWTFTVSVCGPTQTKYRSGTTKSEAIRSFCQSECDQFAPGGYFNEKCNSECRSAWQSGRGGGEAYNLPRSCQLTVK